MATTACLGAELDLESEEMLGEAQEAVLSTNGSFPNGINLNGINLNGINPNGLKPSTLSQHALSPSALTSTDAFPVLTDPGPYGATAREFVRYAVSCALLPSQSFSFSWTDSDGVTHAETYHGELGIAYWWAYNSLSDPFYQKQITACIAARTNRYGIIVPISLRNGELSMSWTAAERDTYTVREGAFWGNLFATGTTPATAPFVRACYSNEGVTRARELMRDCAAGRVLGVDPVTGAEILEPCGPIVIEGSCEDVCNWDLNDGRYLKGCIENSSNSPWIRTDVVVTSFLPPAP